MSNILQFPERSRIYEEASLWLVRLDNSPLTDLEAKELSEWLNTCQQHRDAIVDLCRLWDNLDLLSELSVLFPYSENASSTSKASFSHSRKSLAFFTAIAATALIVVIFLSELQMERKDDLDTISITQDRTYQTSIGEQQEILLADGSMAYMNTRSSMSVSFTDEKRDIRLNNGEVFFKVVHDNNRPFSVYAAGGVVRAVGTAFSVRLKGHNLEVVVAEGKVEIASGIIEKFDENRSAGVVSLYADYLATLSAGQTAEFNNDTIESIKTIEPESVVRKLSWQHGMLEFKDETLEQVITEISRYTDIKIIISDESIRDIRIGGYFRAGEVEALISVLETGFPVSVDRRQEKLIYLMGKADDVNNDG